MLDDPQAAFGRINRRRLKAGKEGDVIIRRVEIRMIEKLNASKLKRSRKRSLSWNSLRQRHVEARPGKDRGTCCGPVLPNSDS